MDSLPTELDFSVLAAVTDEKTMKREAASKKIHYASNKDRFTRVAFDLFREDATNSLWQLSQDATGEEWLTRSDMQDGSNTQEHAKQAWKVHAHKSGKAITLSYQKTPVALFEGQRFGFGPHEAQSFCGFLVRKLASVEFQKQLLNNIPSTRQAALKQEHPELFV